jgi:DNA ligase D-like protein (predicted ligase)
MKKSLQKPKKSASPVQVSAEVPPPNPVNVHVNVNADLGSLALEAGGTRRPVVASRLRPMFCDRGPVSLTRTGFFYELKLDGVRILADKSSARAGQKNHVQLWYRSGRDATDNYPEIAAAVAALAPDDVLVDGEIIALDDEGMPSFQKLQTRIMAQQKGALRAPKVEVALVAFDVLAVAGVDVMRVPLSKRRPLLERIVPDSGVVSRFPQVKDDARALHALCEQRRLEGLVAKDPASFYFPGERTSAWSKIRLERAADFAVVGWTRGEAGRSGIRSLTLASYEEGRFVGRGDVGSGFSDADLSGFKKRLEPLVVKEVPAIRVGSPKERVWVKPEIVVRVRFLALSDEGTLRQPVFLGLRPDVSPEECVLDE